MHGKIHAKKIRRVHDDLADREGTLLDKLAQNDSAEKSNVSIQQNFEIVDTEPAGGKRTSKDTFCKVEHEHRALNTLRVYPFNQRLPKCSC
mmetsp:Transcript_6657/g.40726  ORF Transcript_6657/g.40726 Transcript_6657/m.40726 type:complete len:91 (+) Transcript_6657:410-682(+)